jgi:radical SAM superfamily enzyme YgiQ (UPF0313 family)/tetratricopeptide (TPR) repeat protein
MRVLLIPPKNNYPDPRPSLDIFGQGFPYLAGALKEAGHEVIGVNLNHKWCQDSAPLTLANMLDKTLRENQPQLIGVGGLSADYSFVRDAVRNIRQINSNIPIVLGGGIVTYDPDFIFSNLRPDFAVRGEGEEALVALVNALERETDWCSIANIAYWENGNPIYSKTRDIQTKLEDLPWPDYTPFDFEEYFEGLNQGDNIFAYTRLHPRVMPISLGRSCPFHCTFCCHRYASPYRQRSVDHALEEMVYFYQKYHFNFLFVYDELFSLRKERIREFSVKIKKLRDDLHMDFDWTCDLRVTQVDRDTLGVMKEAGCIFIGYGLESASPRVLKSMKKGITVPQMERAIRLTQEAGIGVQGNFILGDIAETPDTLQETLDFFHRWCSDSFVHLASLTPYPGSEVFQVCLDQGIIKDKQSYYDRVGGIGKFMVNMTTMPDPIFQGLMSQALRITDPSVHTLLPLKEGFLLSCERTDEKFEKNAPPSLRRSLLEFRVTCPHCGENIRYLFPVKKAPEQAHWIRTFCARCHKRFRIKIPEPLILVNPRLRAPRHSSGEEGAKSSSLPAPFHLGDFASAALRKNFDEWETYAALGLVGKSKEAIEGLGRFAHPDALFYTAVAHWIEGEEAAAAQILEKNPTPHARDLLALIRKPQIQVLAQLPWTRSAPHDLLTAAARDKKFKVQNISFHPEDFPNEPYADIHKFFSPQSPPDFYICQMVEWHLIPPNLQELPCPIFGATGDYDLHIQTVHPWLQVFDELIVTDSTEWEDVRRLVRSPVSTFPKSFGVREDLPPIPKAPREIDLFLSGSTTHPYWYEKGKLLNQVLKMPDITMLVIDGFLPPETYQLILGQSKLTFSYVRHSGAMPTRALEALSMGCAAIVQKGSTVALYLGEKEGVFTYDFQGENLAQTIQKVLARWPENEQCAWRGAEIIRQEFALSRVASQYLRYLTFLAAKPRGKREIQPKRSLDQKRSVLGKGWLPGGVTVLQTMLQNNVARWKPRLKNKTAPHLFIDMARELVLNYAAAYALIGSRNSFSPGEKRGITDILSLYKTGLAQFPQSLVLRFNLIRTSLHLGQTPEISEALKLAEETVQVPISTWKIDIMEDVFPYDYQSNFFNYRRYFDEVTESLMEGASHNPALSRLILASLYFYLGIYTQNTPYLRQAIILDPDFPVFKLEYARQLVKRGADGDYKVAGTLLTQMIDSSILFPEAFELLKRLHTRGLYQSQRFTEFGRFVNRYRHSILDIRS